MPLSLYLNSKTLQFQRDYSRHKFQCCELLFFPNRKHLTVSFFQEPILYHQLGVLQFNSILTLTTRTDPTGWRNQPQKTAPLQMPAAKRAPDLPQVGPSAIMTHRTQGSAILRRTYKSREAKWKRCIQQSKGEAQSLHALSRHTALPAHPRVHQSSSLHILVPEFAWKFH